MPGTANKYKLYIVRAKDEPANANADLRDYTGFFLKWKIKHAVSQVAYFEGQLVGINDSNSPDDADGNATTGTRKQDITAGNALYIFAGTKLISKFIIDKPIYNSNMTVNISGYQSTGNGSYKRKLLTENVPETEFKNEQLGNILTSTTSPYGLLNNTSTALIANASIDDSTLRFSMKFEKMNRIQAISKAAGLAKKEFSINHEAGGGALYRDIIYVKNRIGSASSTKTFILTDTNQNAKLSSAGEQIDAATNQVIIQGRDQNGNQVEADIYDSNAIYTTTNYSIDGWLYSNLTSGATSISVTSDSFGSLLNYWAILKAAQPLATFVIKIDNELILCSTITSGSPSSTISVTTRGYSSTDAVAHNTGADVIMYYVNDTVNPYTQNLRAYITDDTVFANTDLADISKIRIGSEIFGFVTFGLDLVGDYAEVYRYTSYETNMYAHGSGAKFMEYTNTAENTGGTFDTTNPKNVVYIGSVSGTFQVGETITGSVNDATATIESTDNSTYIKIQNLDKEGTAFQTAETITGSTSGATCTASKVYYSNSVNMIGLHSVTLNDNVSSNRHQLDIKAQRILDTKKNIIEAISIDCADPIDAWSDINLGDTVTLSNTARLNIDSGDYRIIEYEFGVHPPRLIIYLNSTDTRIYTTGTPEFSSTFSDIQEQKSQEPVRYFSQSTSPASASASGTYDFGNKRLTGVLTPSANTDAANKAYVDGVGTSSNLWATVGSTALKTKTSRAILPFDDSDLAGNGNSLGDSIERWNEVYASIGNFSAAISATQFTIANTGTGTSLIVSNTNSEASEICQMKGVSSVVKFALSTNRGDLFGTQFNALGINMNYLAGVGNGGGTIYDIGMLTFTNNSQNKLSDSAADLIIQGNQGMQLKLYTAGGGVIIGADPSGPTANVSTLRPYANDVTDLGSSSYRWNEVYVGSGGIVFNDSTVQTTAGGGTAVHTHLNSGQGGSSLYPSTLQMYGTLNMNQQNLSTCATISPSGAITTYVGTSGNRFSYGYFTRLYCTNQTAEQYITGAAFIEFNLFSDEQKKELKNNEDFRLDFEEGDVLAWKSGSLIKSYKQDDNLVMAVASVTGHPIVLGAEKIKVIGPVLEGDFLVSSDTPGCAVANNKAQRGTIIAQALENKETEEIGAIKAFISKM